MKWMLVFSFAFGRAPQHANADRWFAVDKWKHFAACAVVQSTAYGVALGNNRHGPALRAGAVSAAVVGLGREVYDWRTKGRFSGKDLVWDALGAGAAAVALHSVR